MSLSIQRNVQPERAIIIIFIIQLNKPTFSSLYLGKYIFLIVHHISNIFFQKFKPLKRIPNMKQPVAIFNLQFPSF